MHEQLLGALGVTPNYSCVCYQYHNIPQFGDILAWAESSAVIYANSVIGARTNRQAGEEEDHAARHADRLARV
jgi:predicted aconitase